MRIHHLVLLSALMMLGAACLNLVNLNVGQGWPDWPAALDNLGLLGRSFVLGTGRVRQFSQKLVASCLIAQDVLNRFAECRHVSERTFQSDESLAQFKQTVEFRRLANDRLGCEIVQVVELQRHGQVARLFTFRRVDKLVFRRKVKSELMVANDEIYASLTAVQQELTEATQRIVNWQIVVLLVSLFIVTLAVYAVSGRITKGLSQLSHGDQNACRRRGRP